MSPLRVLDLDDKVAAAVRDALHRPVRHLTHREQLAVPSGKKNIFSSQEVTVFASLSRLVYTVCLFQIKYILGPTPTVTYAHENFLG